MSLTLATTLESNGINFAKMSLMTSVRFRRYRLHYTKHYIISLSDNCAQRDGSVCGFIVTNVVTSLHLCLRVVTSTDTMHQSKILDRYTIL